MEKESDSQLTTGQGLPAPVCSRTLRRMAAQVGEMLCVSPETGNNLGIWSVSPEGLIGLGTQDGSEFWILETVLHESSEIEVKGLLIREDWESTTEQLARVQSSWDSDRRIFAGALQLLREAGLAPNSTALIAAAERAEADSENT